MSYTYASKNETTPIDNIVITTDEIRSIEDIENAEAQIAKETDRNNVTILSFQVLGKA
jgi:hypothetical protein